MSKILYFVCFFLCLQPVFSQKRGYVQFNAGPSVPLGEFASNVTGKQLAGLAGGGYAVEFVAAHRVLKDNLGLALQLTYNQNEINQVNLVSQANLRLDANWKVKNVAQWTMTTATAGPFWRLEKGDFRMDVRALAGVALVNSPAFALMGTYLNRAATVDTQSKTAQGFAFGVSGSLAYTIYGNLAVCIGLSYLQTQITLTDVPSRTTIGNTNAAALNTETLPVAVLNATGGLRFKF